MLQRHATFVFQTNRRNQNSLFQVEFNVEPKMPKYRNKEKFHPIYRLFLFLNCKYFCH
jgi:hypothetical protein